MDWFPTAPMRLGQFNTGKRTWASSSTFSTLVQHFVAQHRADTADTDSADEPHLDRGATKRDAGREGVGVWVHASDESVFFYIQFVPDQCQARGRSTERPGAR